MRNSVLLLAIATLFALALTPLRAAPADSFPEQQQRIWDFSTDDNIIRSVVWFADVGGQTNFYPVDHDMHVLVANRCRAKILSTFHNVPAEQRALNATGVGNTLVHVDRVRMYFQRERGGADWTDQTLFRQFWSAANGGSCVATKISTLPPSQPAPRSQNSSRSVTTTTTTTFSSSDSSLLTEDQRNSIAYASNLMDCMDRNDSFGSDAQASMNAFQDCKAQAQAGQKTGNRKPPPRTARDSSLRGGGRESGAHEPDRPGTVIASAPQNPYPKQSGDKNYLTEDGKPCITAQAMPTEVHDDGWRNYVIEYTNVCPRGIIIYSRWIQDGPLWNTDGVQSGGIGEGSKSKPAKMSANCVNDPKHRANACAGYSEWWVK